MLTTHRGTETLRKRTNRLCLGASVCRDSEDAVKVKDTPFVIARTFKSPFIVGERHAERVHSCLLNCRAGGGRIAAQSGARTASGPEGSR